MSSSVLTGIKGFVSQGIVLLCAFIGLLWFQQDSLIYPGVSRRYHEPLDTGILKPVFNVQQLRFHTQEDGNQTAVMVLNPAGTCHRLFLTFGGNAMLARDWLGLLRFMPQAPKLGMCFLLVDYPGFGDSEGKPSQASILRTSQGALLTALEQLEQENTEQDFTEPELGAWGHSIGCAAALALADQLASAGTSSKLQLQHLVLSAPFTSLAGMAKTLLPFLFWVPDAPIELLVSSNRWNNLVAIEHLATATLPRVDMIHGLQDEIVPYAMGRELWRSLEAHSCRGSFADLASGHNDLLSSREYGDWFLRLLD